MSITATLLHSAPVCPFPLAGSLCVQETRQILGTPASTPHLLPPTLQPEPQGHPTACWASFQNDSNMTIHPNKHKPPLCYLAWLPQQTYLSGCGQSPGPGLQEGQAHVQEPASLCSPLPLPSSGCSSERLCQVPCTSQRALGHRRGWSGWCPCHQGGLAHACT